MHLAAWYGHTGIVELLLGKGASIVAINTSGNTPLHHAAFNGHTGTVELLLGKGASMEAIGRNDNTPLHLAAQSGHTDIVELLKNKAKLVMHDTNLEHCPMIGADSQSNGCGGGAGKI